MWACSGPYPDWRPGIVCGVVGGVVVVGAGAGSWGRGHGGVWGGSALAGIAVAWLVDDTPTISTHPMHACSPCALTPHPYHPTAPPHTHTPLPPHTYPPPPRTPPTPT